MIDNKKLGFGCMRLPMKGSEVDLEETIKMVDHFMNEGFVYFDTAHGYIQQKSETALKAALTSRYPRDRYILTNKLTSNFFSKKEDIRPLFELQLERCGVDYFDYYLMHAQDAEHYKHFMACDAYQVAQELKAEGKVKHVGISFHDTADVLDMILTEHPEIEIVQIQFNYVDYTSPSVQSKECYEVCVKHGKQILVMEPIKGGGLINLPDQAKKVYDEVNNGLSYASYALRFVAGFENVYKVLSGMSNLEQMEDNTSYMKDFQPLNEKEAKAVEEVTHILNTLGGIPCTACRYCTDGCPMQIKIPDLFSCYNAKVQFNDWNSNYYYGVHTKDNGKASDCLQCGQCEGVCPQHLPIIENLQKIAAIFEK